MKYSDYYTSIAFEKKELYPGAPYLIFLHDSLGCITLWRDFPEKLAQVLKMNYIIYDRLGYGQSDPFINKERTLDYMEEEADFLIELLDYWELKEAILFGHSDGASISLIAAGKYPHKIKSIIVQGLHVFVEDITIAGIQAAEEAYKTTNLKERLVRYHGDKTEDLFMAWTQTWQKDFFQSWNIEHWLKNIECPVLIIQGENDEFGSMKQVEAVEQQVKGPLQSLLVKNAGHTPTKEQPDIVLDFVVDNIPA